MEAEWLPLIHTALEDKIYIAHGVESMPFRENIRLFRPVGLVYHPLCDDFGPMNLSSLIQFVEQLEEEITSFPYARIVFCVEDGKRALTNACFLMGAYLILIKHMSSSEVTEIFSWLDGNLVEPFRDATYSEADFGLTLSDCWSGFEKGIAHGWICKTIDGEMWGNVNIEEYRHYDNPCNGDLHEVVPGKFIAFKGPKELRGQTYQDDRIGSRSLDPSFFIEVFEDLNVKAVIRLNEFEYDSTCFSSRGISHYDLEFEDCTPPPARTVEAFFDIVDKTDGAIAIHCMADGPGYHSLPCMTARAAGRLKTEPLRLEHVLSPDGNQRYIGTCGATPLAK